MNKPNSTAKPKQFSLLRICMPYLPLFIRNKLQNVDGELISGSLVFFLTKVLGIAFTYFFAFYVTRTMGAGKWGFITLMITSINIVSVFCIFGLDVLLIKYTSKQFKSDSIGVLRTIYKNALFLSFVFVVITLGVCLAFPQFVTRLIYGSSNILPWFTVALIGLPANVVFQLNNAALAGMKNMVAYGIYKNIVLFGGGLLVYIIGTHTIFPMYFSRFQEGGILILASYVGVIYLGMFFNSIQVLRKMKFTLNPEKSEGFGLKRLVSESFPLLLAASMTLIISSTDYFMLSHFKSQVEIGLYDIAVKISIITAIVLVAVNAISTPKFSEFYSQNDIKSLKNIVRQSAKLIFWGASPLLVLILLFPEFILSLFGNEFKVASTALIFLTLGQFVNAVSGSGGNLLKMTNHQNILRNIVFVAAVTNIGLNFMLIPKYGITGAAVASFVSMCVWHISSSLYVYWKLKIKTFYIPFIA